MSAGEDPVLYSRGSDTFDAWPSQRSAPSFEAFADAVLSDRSKAKGLTWISAPFRPNSDGRYHRCKDGALPRRFLALDLDGGTTHGVVELGMWLGAFSGFGYTTSSHTTANPHSRHVLELSRAVDRDEGIRLGEALQRLIEARVGSRALRLDPSVYRGEQPLYGPLVGADVMRYDGDPIDVDAVLALVPKEEPRVRRADEPDPYRAALLDRGLVLRELGPGKDAITCPFAAEHSEVTSLTSTVYLWPLHGGYKRGHIDCKHAHCAERNKDQRLYIEKLGLEPRSVWRGQAGAAPCDDLPPLESYAGDAAQGEVRQHTEGAKAAGGNEYRSGAAPGGGPGNATTPPGGVVSPGASFLTAAMLWNMQHDPTHWAVPGILPEGVCVEAGKPKIGKSWLALDLALAVGTGGLALGAIEVEAGPVLYLALEDTKRRLTKRLRILCGNAKPPPEQIEFLTDCPRLGSGGEEVLRAWLREHPTARLVVIDTLPRFRPHANAKETLYANDYVVGEYLSRLCVEFQVSILVLCHTRKQPGEDPIDEISGTLGLAGSVDGYMVLRRPGMSDEATLYVCGRDVDEPAEHCLSWDRSRARWSVTGGDPRVSRLPTEQRRAYELLSKAPKNAKELTEALNPGHVVTDPASDTRRRAAEAIAHKLLEKGLIARRPFDRRWAPIHPNTTTTSSTRGRWAPIHPNTTTTSSTRESGDEVVPGISGMGGSGCFGGPGGQDRENRGTDRPETGTSAPAGDTRIGACPSCAGEGCRWCGGMGRLVDDQPREPAA